MAARYNYPASSQPAAPATKNTRNYLEEDFLFLPSDPGGSDSDSDSEVDDSPAEPKSRLQPTTVTEQKAASTRSSSGLKIIIPRKRGSAVIARRNVGDDFEDLDEEDEDDLEYESDEEEEPPESPSKHRKIDYRGARSPLSASSNVYAGHRCTIGNCRFTATTAQHLRHHIATAQHSRNLRSAYAGPG